jgi:hypothetical protein
VSLPGYAADWPAPTGVRTWQTIRAGGVSRGEWASLNLGPHVGDDPGHVVANRARLRAGLKLPGEPVWLEQVHGRRVLRVDAAETGRADAAETGRADAAVTAAPGVVLAVMTADCLPVLLATRDGRRIGVAHAGWRGLAAGVLAEAVAAIGGDPAELVAWLGPAISQAAFEVGDEVRAAFVGADPGAAGAFAENARGRWQADLYALARRRLRQAGVDAVSGGGACTRAEVDRYFSHRRAAPCGRMASLIWREPGPGTGTER